MCSKNGEFQQIPRKKVKIGYCV